MKKEENPKEKNRSNSYKKPVMGTSANKNSSNSNPSLNKEQRGNQKEKTYEENVIDEEIETEEKEKAKMEEKRKVKDDLNAMKRTMRNEKNE
jgi:hypothetical protein